MEAERRRVRDLEQEVEHLNRELDRLERHMQALNIELEEERRVHDEDVDTMHAKLERTRSRNEHHQRLLAHEVKYLREKVRREAGFRTDLAFQKRYLVHLVGGMEADEKETLRLISHVMQDEGLAAGGSFIRSPDGSMMVLPSLKNRFRAAVYCVIAINRLHILRGAWQKVREVKYGGQRGPNAGETRSIGSRPRSIVSETAYQRFD